MSTTSKKFDQDKLVDQFQLLKKIKKFCKNSLVSEYL